MTFRTIAYDSIRAADAFLMDESKWIKRVMRRDGRACLSGAIPIPSNGSSDAWVILRDVARRLYPKKRWSCLADFNDDPDTTFAMVKAVLKEALSIYE